MTASGTAWTKKRPRILVLEPLEGLPGPGEGGQVGRNEPIRRNARQGLGAEWGGCQIAQCGDQQS